MQHGHMDQVGYDTYCKLLDEVVKESKGIKVKEEIDVVIDINVSSFIPNEYISNNSQKIEVYQNIALCRTEKDIEDVVEDVTDRYGKMPKEMISLLSIAKIKEMCKNLGVSKIAQKQNNIIFYFIPDIFDMDIQKLIHKYKERIKFSSGITPYITYKVKDENNIIEEIEEFFNGNN